MNSRLLISKIFLSSFIAIFTNSISAQEIITVPISGNKQDILSFLIDEKKVEFIQLRSPSNFKKDSFNIQMKTDEKIITLSLNKVAKSDINLVLQTGVNNVFFLEVDGVRHEINFSNNFNICFYF